MNLTLYHGEPNGPSLSVLAALFEKGVAADLVRIDLAHGERHGPACERSVEVEMAVEGEGPVLVADGEAMAESVFIGCFLDDLSAANPLRPADPYARWEVMAWLRWLTERASPAAAFLGTRAHLHGRLAAENDGRFAAIVHNIVSEDLRARWEDVRAGNFPDTQAEDSKAKIHAAAERIEAKLGDGREWLFGSFGLADIECFAWLVGMVEEVPDAFEARPRTSEWMERMRARPAIARALALATLPHPERNWAPGPEINRWG